MSRFQYGFGIILWILSASSVSVAQGGEVNEANSDLRFNEVQIIGTHNSFHIAPDQTVGILMKQKGYSLSKNESYKEFIPYTAYSHLPLKTQLTMGIRQFELDVFEDTEGGKYQIPGIDIALKHNGLPIAFPFDPKGVMKRPGFKVFHTIDVDVRSTCLTLVECLGHIQKWSKANPNHVPIMVILEIKEQSLPAVDESYEPTPMNPFRGQTWSALQQEILTVLPRDQILTPDDVRGDYATLNEAILSQGWPTLREAAGKIMLTLDNTGETLDDYLVNSGNLEGALLFPSAKPGHPTSAWVKLNDPYDPLIPDLVAQGYMIRTRADSNTIASRKNDPSSREQAFRSGAHFVSTDYPFPDPRLSDYEVRFNNGGYIRCNPITMKKKCPF